MWAEQPEKMHDWGHEHVEIDTVTTWNVFKNDLVGIIFRQLVGKEYQYLNWIRCPGCDCDCCDKIECRKQFNLYHLKHRHLETEREQEESNNNEDGP